MDDEKPQVMEGRLTRPMSAPNIDGSWNLPEGSGPPLQAPATPAAPAAPATPVQVDEQREYQERAVSAPPDRRPQSDLVLPDGWHPNDAGPFVPDGWMPGEAPAKPRELPAVHDEVKDLDPDQAAKIYEMSRQLGESPAFVQHNLAELQKAQKRARGPELDKIEDHYPGTAKFLSKPENMAVSKDDLENLRHHENLFTDYGAFSKMMRAFRSTGASLLAGLHRSGPYLHAFANFADNMELKRLGRPQLETPEWLKRSDAAEYYDRIAKEYAVSEASEEILREPEKKAVESLGGFLEKVLALGSYQPGQFLPGLPGEEKPAPRPKLDLKAELAPVIDAAKNFDYGRAISLMSLKVAQSAPSTAITLAATMASAGAGGPLALGGIGLSTASGAYKEARDKGLDQTASTQRGTMHGVSEALSESIELGIMKEWADVLRPAIGKLATREILLGVGKTVGHAAGGEGFAEWWNSLVQSYADYSTRYDPEMTPSRAFWRAVDAGLVGIASGAALTTPGAVALAVTTGKAPDAPVPIVSENQADDIRKRMEEGGTPEGAGEALDRAESKPARDTEPAWMRVAQALERMKLDGQEQDAVLAKDLYNQVGELAGSSKLRERSADAHREHVNGIAEANDSRDIFIPVEAVNRIFEARGESPIAAMQALGFATQYEEAVDAGTAVQLPYADWVHKTLSSDLYKAFENDIRFSADPDAVTMNELKERREEDKAAREALAKADEEAQADEPEAVPSAQAPEVRESADAVQAAFQNTMAQATGLTPEQVKSVYPLEVKSEGEPDDAEVEVPDGIELFQDGNDFNDRVNRKVIDAEKLFRARAKEAGKKLPRKGQKPAPEPTMAEKFAARFDREDETDKTAADAVRMAQDPAQGPYVSDANIPHIGWAPNYEAKPTGVIGPARISEPNWMRAGLREDSKVTQKPPAEIDPLTWADLKWGATKALIRFHAETNTPLTINTSSDLIGHDEYINLLPERTTVNVYLLSRDDAMNRALFPGNPSRLRQERAIERLRERGITVNAIEPTVESLIKAAGGKRRIAKYLGIKVSEVEAAIAETGKKDVPANVLTLDVQPRPVAAEGSEPGAVVVMGSTPEGRRALEQHLGKYRELTKGELATISKEIDAINAATEVADPDADADVLDNNENRLNFLIAVLNESKLLAEHREKGGTTFSQSSLPAPAGKPPAPTPTVSPLGFYSQVEAEVLKMDFKSMPAKDLAARIKNIQGVKAEELEWMGLMDWLAAREKEAENPWTFHRDGEKPDGKVTRDEVLAFVRQNGVRVEQTVLADAFGASKPVARLLPRSESELPLDTELEWDEGETQEPNGDWVTEEGKYRLWEYAGGAYSSENSRHALFGDAWAEHADEVFREELLDDDRYVLSYEKDEDGHLADNVKLEWNDDGLPSGATGVDFGKGEAGEKRKAKLLKRLKEALEEHFTPEAERQALESYWEDSDYQEIRYTESETGWTLEGRPGDGEWWSPDTQKHYRGSIEEAQVKIREDMIDKGVVETDEMREARIAAEETGEPVPGTRYTAPIGPEPAADPSAPTGKAKWGSYRVPGGSNYREILLTLPAVEGDYRSGHWSEKNVLAHVRLTDRIDADGNKTLFIEEMQSDLHQQGRERGYKSENEAERDAVLKELRPLRQKIEQAHAQLAEKYPIDGRQKSLGELGIEEGYYTEQEYERRGQLEARASELSRDSSVPDAPFKNTDAWAQLALKRILRLAVEQGYDAVAWAPAEVHVERWGTDSISWVKKSGGFSLIDPDGQVVDTWESKARLFAYLGIKSESEVANGFRIESVPGDTYFLVGSVEQVGGRAGDVDIEGEARRRGELLERRGERVTTKEELRKVVADTLHRERNDRSLEALTESLWKQMQEKDSGVKAPRKEGMEFFYDNVLPKKVAPAVLKKLDKEAKVKVGEIQLEGGSFSLLPEDDSHYSVWEIPLTDALKAKVKEGQTLFQPAKPGSGPRGQIQIGNEKALLRFLQTADPSTWVHELGHYYLESVARFIEAGHASEKLTSYLTTVQTWWTEKADHVLEVLREKAKEATGEEKTRLDAMLAEIDSRGGAEYIRSVAQNWRGQVGEVGQFVVEQLHEYHARGLEAFLMEGKAPSPQLASAFARFQEWLFHIYKELTALNVELTPEVRQAFARLLATEEEIKAAEAMQAMEPLIKDPAAVGMSPRDAERYNRATAEAQAASRSELNAALAQQEQRRQKAAYKARRAEVEREVRASVAARREQLAFSVLSRGTMPDGSELPTDQTGGFGSGSLRALKLDRSAIVEEWGEDRLKDLPRPYVYAREGGVHPDVAAEMFSAYSPETRFSSGDELLAELTSVEPFEVVVKRETDARMKAEHGDMLTDGTLPLEAMKAAHTEKRAKLLQMELEFLVSKKPGAFRGLLRSVAGRPRTAQAFREQAEAVINAKRVRDINPALYQRAEAKAAKEAVTLFGKGDIEGAIRAKERQLLNFHLYRAAVRAREQVESVVDYMGRFTKQATRERLGKAGQEYLAQIDAIMERFDFRQVSNGRLEKRLSLRDWIEEQRAMGFDPVVPEKLVNEAFRTHHKELEFGELTELRDTVKNIARLASLKTKLMKAQAARELEAAADDAVASIEAHSKGARPKEIETRLPGQDLHRIGAGFLASHRKFASLIRQMDGFENGGVMWELLVRPMNEAGTAEAVAREKAAERLSEIFSVYGIKDINALYRKTFIPEADVSLTRMGMLMVALNWGNTDNRTKLMAGYGWTEAEVQAILDRLDERDVAVVNQVWEFIDSYWPESKALSERVTGVAPEKIEASPFQARGGSFRGGYFPLKYDDRQSPRAYAHLAKEQAERAMHGGAVRATTKHGHRESRVSGVKLPVRLDFGSIFEHVTEVIHDQTHYEFLIDANRILGHGRIQAAILSHYGDIVYGQLRDAIEDIAAGDVGAQTSFERAINWVRTGSSIAAMGWSVMTTLQQPLGITQSMVRIGPKWVAKGLGRFLGDAARMESTAQWIYEKSEFMRLRGKTMLREVSEIRNQLRVKGAVLGPVEDSYFWLISRGQLLVDIPTWVGAYEKAAEETEDEARRVALADQAVLDSQGGGQVKDLAQIQRGGPLLKLWTNFYSFFNTTYNLTAESIGRTEFRDPHSVGRLAVDMLLLYSAPAILGMALKDALRGGDDDRKKGLAQKLAREQAAYLASTMVGIREMSGLIQGFQNYEGPGGARFFSAAGKLAKQVQQGEADEAFWRSLNQAAGIVFHYPALQLERTARGIIALEKGKTSNPLAPLVGPPKK
jgi:hypothetical protein